MNRRQHRMCGSKQRHETEEAARAHLDALVADPDAERLAVYLCDYCRGFHVGHRRREAVA